MDAKRSFYRRIPDSAFTAEDRALKSAGGIVAAQRTGYNNEEYVWSKKGVNG